MDDFIVLKFLFHIPYGKVDLSAEFHKDTLLWYWFMNNISLWLKHLDTDKGSYKDFNENILLQIIDHTQYDSCSRSRLCGVGREEWGKRAVSAGNTVLLWLLPYSIELRRTSQSSPWMQSYQQWLVFGRSAGVVEGQSCCYHGYQRAASLISPHDSYLATNSSPYPW